VSFDRVLLRFIRYSILVGAFATAIFAGNQAFAADGDPIELNVDNFYSEISSGLSGKYVLKDDVGVSPGEGPVFNGTFTGV